MPWDAEFEELMPDQVTWQPRTGRDAYGRDTYGTAQTVKCRIVRRPRMVRGPEGREEVSSTTIYVAGVKGIKIDDKITLPNWVAGDDQPDILSVFTYPDEDGPYYEELTLA